MDTELVESEKSELKKKLKLNPNTDKEVLKDLDKSKTEMRSSVSMTNDGLRASFNIDQNGDKNSVYKNFEKTFKNVDEYAGYLKKFFAADPD